MMFSYFPYAAAFSTDDAGAVSIDVGLVGIALVIAPFVFVTVALVSMNPRGPRKVLQSMGLLLPIALGVGLLSPVLGATAGFGVGGALCLREPDIPGTLKRRLLMVVFTVAYTLFLLVVITPAGVFAGGLLPLLTLGFSDEFGFWKASRSV